VNKKYYSIFITLGLCIVFSIQFAAAQQYEREDILKASFDNPSQPGKVVVKWNNGDVYIKTHDGTDVLVDPLSRKHSPRRRWSRNEGLTKIYDGNAVEIETKGNEIRVSCFTMYRHVDVEISVPQNAEVYVVNQLNGSVEIENVDSDIEVETLNGDIFLKNISGSVTAYSTNGEIIASMQSIDQSDKLVLTTLNGDIDIELPPMLKATLFMTTRDEIYTDFDVQQVSNTTENWRSRSRNRLEYTINGGGIEIELKSLHGDIYIRKTK